MKLKRLARWAGGLWLAAGLLAGGGAMAQTGPAAPAAPMVVLYDQINNPGGNFVDSSDWGSHFPTVSSQAADDFVVPKNVFWRISQATASGQIILSDGNGVLSLLVQFYTDNGGGLPASRIYSQTIASGSIGGLATGVFVISLASPLTLGPGHYWFSAQAHEQCTTSGCKHWVWTERSLKSQAESVWQNPLGGYGPTCPTWKPRITVCQQPNGSTSPDLLFRLDGTTLPVVGQVFLPVMRR